MEKDYDELDNISNASPLPLPLNLKFDYDNKAFRKSKFSKGKTLTNRQINKIINKTKGSSDNLTELSDTRTKSFAINQSPKTTKKKSSCNVLRPNIRAKYPLRRYKTFVEKIANDNFGNVKNLNIHININHQTNLRD